MPSENGYVPVRVNWLPNVNGRPGSHFFVKYRKKGATTWLDSDQEFNNDFIIISGLLPDTEYEFAAISVDGDHLTESNVQEVITVGVGKCHDCTKRLQSVYWHLLVIETFTYVNKKDIALFLNLEL